MSSAAIDSKVDHLFRYEAGKMVSILTRIFGAHNLEIVEDVIQDTFVKALHHWRYKMPEQPSAWLMRVARNAAIDVIRRKKHEVEFAPDLTNQLRSEWSIVHTIDEQFETSHISDSQLAMIFTACHPVIPTESQIALTLKTICGFSVKEIAKALLTTEANINKRLYRARQLMRNRDVKFELPPESELLSRLDSVHLVIYLLFNEGYNSTHPDELIRKDLCFEAMRLCRLLEENSAMQTPNMFALMALMCFHAARFDSRQNEFGGIILLEHQDRSLWDKELIRLGVQYIEKSSAGNYPSHYHIEAGIAAYHCLSESYEGTDWNNILKLYDMLLNIKNSPVVILNRIIAYSKVHGARKALDHLEKVEIPDSYYLYHATMGELYRQLDEKDKAVRSLQRATELTQSKPEKELLQARINQCLKEVT